MIKNSTSERKNATVPFTEEEYSIMQSIANSEYFQGNLSLAIKTILNDYRQRNKSINIPEHGDFTCSDLVENGNRRLNLKEIKKICDCTLRPQFIDNLNNLSPALKISVYNFNMAFAEYLHKEYLYYKKLKMKDSLVPTIGSKSNVSFYNTQGLHCLYICVDKVINTDLDDYLGISHLCRFVGGRYKETNKIIDQILGVLKNNDQEIKKIEKGQGYYVNATGFQILADYYKKESENLQNKIDCIIRVI